MSNTDSRPALRMTPAQRAIAERLYHGQKAERTTLGRQTIAKVGGVTVRVEDLDAVEAEIGRLAATVQTARIVGGEPILTPRQQQLRAAKARRAEKAAIRDRMVAWSEAGNRLADFPG